MGKVNELQEREAEQEVVELEEAENLEEGEESLKKGKGRKCFLCPLWLNGPTQMDDHSIGKSISQMLNFLWVASRKKIGVRKKR